ncbi:MAG: cupredoxin domain-containing protein [Longimicrobiales bacterium]
MRDEKLDIGSDTIDLAPGVEIREIRVRLQSESEFEPARVQARVGDVIRFQTSDARTHVLGFLEDSIPPGGREWLASRSQLRSPPLLVEGATWIVSLEGAPPGAYTFHCVTHGLTGRIAIE